MLRNVIISLIFCYVIVHQCFSEDTCSFFIANDIYYDCNANESQICMTCDFIGNCYNHPVRGYTSLCVQDCHVFTDGSACSPIPSGEYWSAMCNSDQEECLCETTDCKLDYYSSNAIRNCTNPYRPATTTCINGEVPDLESCSCVDPNASTTSTVSSTSTLTTTDHEISPEDECEFDGDQVCSSCTSFATCTQVGDSSFEIDVIGMCSPEYICVSTSESTGTECKEAESSSPCFCDGSVFCSIDPINDKAVLDCSQGYPVSYICDEDQEPNLINCSCE